MLIITNISRGVEIPLSRALTPNTADDRSNIIIWGGWCLSILCFDLFIALCWLFVISLIAVSMWKARLLVEAKGNQVSYSSYLWRFSLHGPTTHAFWHEGLVDLVLMSERTPYHSTDGDGHILALSGVMIFKSANFLPPLPVKGQNNDCPVLSQDLFQSHVSPYILVGIAGAYLHYILHDVSLMPW